MAGTTGAEAFFVEDQKMVITSDHPLAGWNEAFLIVSADDEFPTWHQRLYVFSTEDLAAGFTLGHELSNVAVRDIDCPAGLLELLADVEDEGCDGLSVDGVQLPLTDAIHSLQSAGAASPSFPIWERLPLT